MNAFIKLLLVCGIFICMAFSCEKISEKPEKEENPETENYSPVKIININCGGTVLQVIDTNEIIGETWNNFMVSHGSPVISYPNCVLAWGFHRFFPLNEFMGKERDTIFIKYYKVDWFTIGDSDPMPCAIGGLPKTKIDIIDVLDSK